MEARKIKLLEFIGNGKKTFNIPVYQRNYDWKEEQCRKLFEDIQNIVKSDYEIEHFLGTVVFVSSKSEMNFNEYVLIDGQQRITSIMLLLKVLHEKVTDENDKEEIWEEYLINKRAPEENLRIRLKPVESDGMPYKKLIEENDISLTSNVCKNYRLFEKLIQESNYSAEEIYKALGKIELVYIQLEKGKKSENPQMIFESLNSTGLSLTQGDLIRNYLLMNHEYEKQKMLYKNFWLEIEKRITNEKISDFVRDYLTMKNGSISNKDKVYDDFKKYIKQNNENMDEEGILEELKTYSEYYSWFLNGNSPNNKINEKLSEFRYLRNTTVYPLILSVFEDTYSYKNINENELFDILNLLISYIFRRSVCGYTTNSLNKVFASIVVLLKSKDIYKQIEKGLMSKSFPGDEEFRAEFIKCNFYKKGTEFCKYTLKLLETFENKEQTDMENITIEHIMPQTLNSEWRIELGSKFEQIHSEYINTIGNLTLTGYNPELSNKNFELKKRYYEESNIKMSREITNYDKWKDTEIKDRAEQLFEKAKRIWKLPQGYDNKNIDNLEYGKNYLLGSNINITGKKPSKLIISGKEYSIKSWKELIEKLCLELYELEPRILRELIYNPSFKGKEKDIVTQNKEKLRAPVKIDEDLYIESNLNSNAILNYANMIATEYELEEEIFFVLRK
nr:DUF262 domain-containing HNH endonuclease family protein [uncultured Leptotrichia sp.]